MQRGKRYRALLTDLLASAPQQHGRRATGWTVPLWQGELAARGTVVGAQTIRRALHRLGYRWKRPRCELGRPAPTYAEKRGGDRPGAGHAHRRRGGLGGR